MLPSPVMTDRLDAGGGRARPGGQTTRIPAQGGRPGKPANRIRAAGGPGAWLPREIVSELSADHPRQTAQATFGMGKIAPAASPFAARKLELPLGTEQAVPDVHGHPQLLEPPAAGRGAEACQLVQGGPLLDRPPARSRNSQPRARARPKPPSLVALPPMPARQRFAPAAASAGMIAPGPRYRGCRDGTACAAASTGR